MSSKLEQTINVGTEIAREAANSPKVAAWLSAWILGVNWIDAIPVVAKVISTTLALVALCLVLSNHWLTRKKLKLEIKKLTEEAKQKESDN